MRALARTALSSGFVPKEDRHQWLTTDARSSTHTRSQSTRRAGRPGYACWPAGHHRRRPARKLVGTRSLTSQRPAVSPSRWWRNSYRGPGLKMDGCTPARSACTLSRSLRRSGRSLVNVRVEPVGSQLRCEAQRKQAAEKIAVDPLCGLPARGGYAAERSLPSDPALAAPRHQQMACWIEPTARAVIS